MTPNQCLVWRLVLDRMTIFNLLPVLSTCHQMNHLYSEDDWSDIYYRSGSQTKQVEGSMKRYYLTMIRDNVETKLKIISESYQNIQLNSLDWSNYSLTEMYHLYLESVKMVVAEELAQKQRIVNQLQDQLKELLERNPRHADEMADLTELFQSPQPDPVMITNEFHRLLEADPSSQAVAQQFSQLTSKCVIS